MEENLEKGNIMSNGNQKKSGRYPWKSDVIEQRAIGSFVNELRRIHKKSPENDGSIRRIIDSFGYVYDGNDHPSEIEGTPIRDAIKKKVFEG